MFALYDSNQNLLRTVRSPRNLPAPSGVTFADASAVPGETLKANGVYPVRDPGKPDMTGKRLTGTRVDLVDGDAVLVYETADKTAEELAADLAAAKAKAVAAIDQQAGRERLAIVTDGAYQDEEYRRAAEEAQRLIDGTISESAALQADVDAGTVDPRTAAAVTTQAEAADLVLYRRAEWETALDAIRCIRLAAKAAIAAAATEADVAAAQQVVTWPSEAEKK